MNIFESFLMNMIMIIFPIYMYFIYSAYNRNVEKRENDLFFLFALISSYYFVSKYLSFFPNVYVYSLDIILFLSYISKRKDCIFLISILNIYVYYNNYHFSLYLLLIEYTIYGLIYFFNAKNIYRFSFLFILIKTFFIFFFHSADITTFFIFYLMIYLSFITYESGEDIMKYYHSMKELEKEKILYKSLFKITHEIKNPIAVCKGYLDMYDDKNPKTYSYIPIVKGEIERTLVLLEDFLSIHHLRIEKDLMDITLLLEDVVDHFKIICREKKINLYSNFTEDEVYICADYHRLLQVLINMIKNSMEALHNTNKAYIKISMKQTSEKIYILIEDNGEGMDQETLDRVKEPFFSTKEKGSGIGVCLSSQIIEAHGGELIYESAKDEGTKVTIKLNKEA